MERFAFRNWKDGKMFNPHPLIGEIFFDGLPWNEKENGILMQCTGITDRTGMPIFEGDIIELVIACGNAAIEKGTRCLVRWNKFLLHYELDINGENQILLTNPDGIHHPFFEEHYNEEYQDFDKSRLVLTGAKGRNIVVVGNIYESPDLLK